MARGGYEPVALPPHLAYAGGCVWERVSALRVSPALADSNRRDILANHTIIHRSPQRSQLNNHALWKRRETGGEDDSAASAEDSSMAGDEDDPTL